MKLFGNKYRYFFILLLGSYSYVNSYFLETFSRYDLHESPFFIWIGFMLIVLLVWEGNRIIETQVPKFRSGPNPLLPQFLASMLLALVSGIIVYLVIPSGDPELKKSITSIDARLATAFALRVNLFLQCLNAMFYYVNRSQQSALEAESLRTSTAQAKLESIRNQVNPHFLFNNLNVLSALVMTKNQEANTFIESFSTVYRYILSKQQNETVTLAEEKEFIGPYIFLLEKRYGKSFSVSFDLPDSFMEHRIVPVALQMLIENAIKHNVTSTLKPLNIMIALEEDGSLAVSNNLQPKEPDEPSSNTGLKNIAERYKLISGKGIRITRGHNFFKVSLPLLKPDTV